MASFDEFVQAVPETLAGWWRDTRRAAGFLTRLPVSAVGEAAAPLASAVRGFPIVGAGVGLAAGAVFTAASWLGLQPLAAALIALAVAVLLTGALHEDGLADTVDGFGGGKTPRGKLKIMRDSRIGTYGVLAVVLSVVLRAALVAGLDGPASGAAALIAAGAASRAVLPVIMLRLEPARRDGLAVAAGEAQPGDVGAAALLGGLLALLFLGPFAGLLALVAGSAAAAAVAVLARRQIGGHTGDVLGAAQQATEVAVLAAAAAAL